MSPNPKTRTRARDIPKAEPKVEPKPEPKVDRAAEVLRSLPAVARGPIDTPYPTDADVQAGAATPDLEHA